MGIGEKSPRSFHLHQREGKKQEFRGVPKGCIAIKVGQGEEQQRFVVPVIYINHPLFMQLLKEAEEEYGFDQKGTITIPCHVEEFRNVRGLIDRDKSLHNHHHVGINGKRDAFLFVKNFSRTGIIGTPLFGKKRRIEKKKFTDYVPKQISLGKSGGLEILLAFSQRDDIVDVCLDDSIE
ncbi:hypothetical protein VNO78_25056 [Psophocarpus tetragonolobus]|uniref:Small auxin up regulated protein n=1 Tax=Psophocarpus tetragonolobus TaxID=3891 RepID=A0AAN9S9D7_PSOTE